jgi:hypothetical protein
MECMQNEIKKQEIKVSGENLKVTKLENKLDEYKEKANKKYSEVVHK